MEEIWPVVLWKYQFENSKKLKGFLWNFRTISILMHGKNDNFLVRYLLVSAMFPTEILIEEIELAVAEIQKSEFRAKSK